MRKGMRNRTTVLIVVFAFCLAPYFTGTVEALPKMALGGDIFICDNTTPLNGTAFEDGTGFAIWVNNSTTTPPFYKWTRYPAAGWYATIKGRYSMSLPDTDWNVTYSSGSEYRVEIDGIPFGYSVKNATSNGTGSYVSSGGFLPNDGDPEFSMFGNVSNTIAYWEWQDPPGVWQTDDFQKWDVITDCSVIRIVDLPPPPSPTLDADDETGEMTIEWANVSGLDIVDYTIYWARSLGQLNFSEPQATVRASGDVISYTHEDAIGFGSPNELYYVVRSVNASDWEGPTSDIVGKFTIMVPRSYSTFSLPLEPFTTNTASWYLEDMNLKLTDALFRFDAPIQGWIPHPRFLPPDVADFPLVMGETYMVYSQMGKDHYTFVGRPATTLRFSNGANLGLEPDDPRLGVERAFRNSLLAEENGDDIVLTWTWDDTWNVTPLESLSGFDVYRAESRGGFDFSTPHANLSGYQLTWTDYDADGDEYYYIVLPRNVNERPGSSTFAVCVKRVSYGNGYSAFASYLIPTTGGISMGDFTRFGLSEGENLAAMFWFDAWHQNWVPHPTFRPPSFFDPMVKLGQGNLIYLLRGKDYTFIGR